MQVAFCQTCSLRNNYIILLIIFLDKAVVKMVPEELDDIEQIKTFSAQFWKPTGAYAEEPQFINNLFSDSPLLLPLDFI